MGSAQPQAIVSNSLSGELLNLEPIDGAPEVDKLVELIGDENLEALRPELLAGLPKITQHFVLRGYCSNGRPRAAV